MSQYGADLQSNIMELVKYIEKFKTQRILLDESIKKEETERLKIVHEIDALQIKLDAKDEKVNQLRDHRAELNVVLETTEEHLRKLFESSDTALSYLKHEVSDSQRYFGV